MNQGYTAPATTFDSISRMWRSHERGWRRGQAMLEYAVFVAVVVAALTAMSVYVRRSIQANLKSLEDQINAEAL